VVTTCKKDVDGRDKPGHDGSIGPWLTPRICKGKNRRDLAA
jgi:hypothetical protein